MLGRYTLEVIDEESQLLRIMASELRDKPKMLAETLSSLIRESLLGHDQWVRQHAPSRPTTRPRPSPRSPWAPCSRSAT